MKKLLMFSWAIMFVLFAVSAHAVPTTLYFHEYNATASSLDFPGISSGEISISLDLSGPAAQTFTYDLATSTWGTNIDLLLTFGNPAFGSGAAIHVSDEGPILGHLPFPFFAYYGLQYDTSLTSGTGTVFDGSVFSYTNSVLLYDADYALPNGPNYITEFEGPLSIIYPDGSGGVAFADSYLTGSGLLASSPVPEPATMLLLGSGLVGLAGFGRKKIFKDS